MLQAGRTFSGRERNCAFLNTRGRRFADISGVSGLDHVSDSRAVVTTDWDLDGDLDLWFSNRTSPRVRFLRNDATSGHHFLAIRLEGVQSNRDAIGARIELHAEQEAASRPLIRTLRAGDGYLSQSSKWIHFGLGAEAKIGRLVIHWPGGQVEEIRGLKPDTRYRVTQGSGVAVVSDPPRRSLRLEPSVPSVPVSSRSTRIFPHRRLPLPRLEYIGDSGQREVFAPPRAGFRLLTLWATWCQPCLVELRALAKEERKLREAGLEVVALNVDDPNGDYTARLRKARASLEKLNIQMRGGIATAATVELLDVVQRVLLSTSRPLALPSSFLIDAEGRLVAFYRGAVSGAQLRKDLDHLARPWRDPRDAAIPFAGRWVTDPFPPDVLAIPQKLLEISLAGEALAYLRSQLIGAGRGQRPTASLPAGVSAARLVDLFSRIGTELRTQGKLDRAVAAFGMAVSYGPRDWNVRSRLATTLEKQGRFVEALAEHRRTLELRPGHVLSENNIAWILATSSDRAVRDPPEAVRRAKEVCRRTRYRMPSALDTLAAAYAAAGRFEEAIKTAQNAVELATSANAAESAARIRSRLRLYEAGRSYVETPGQE